MARSAVYRRMHRSCWKARNRRRRDAQPSRPNISAHGSRYRFRGPAGRGDRREGLEKPLRRRQSHARVFAESRLWPLQNLQPHLISLVLNDGLTPGSHQLMMKGGGEALFVNFTEAQISDSLKSIRDALDWASRNDARSGPRFPADQVEGAVFDFDQVIWRLAEAGHVLHDELFSVALATPLEEALRKAIQDRDGLIQAVHLTRNFAFPWTSIYDFDLPPHLVGRRVPTICKDFRRKNPDGTTYSCAECLDRCTYPDKINAVCVYGFWGTRLQVEQLIADKTKKPRELRPVGPGAVAFTTGLSGRFLQEIPNDLTQRLGASVRQIPDDEELAPTLWTDRRPAILLLVGHYRTKIVDDEPKGPRLTLSKGFLQPGDILKQRRLHPQDWTDPRTVYFAGRMQWGCGRHHHCIKLRFYEGVARRFAVEMCEALVTGKSVGAAVVEFRRRLLQNLNPLDLLFTAYGFADLAAPTTH
jgi:hypothetical protein